MKGNVGLIWTVIWTVMLLELQTLVAAVCDFPIDPIIVRGAVSEVPRFWGSSTKDIVECALLCLRRKKCKAFNFNTGNRMCDLLPELGTPTRRTVGGVYSVMAHWPSQLDPGCYDRPCGEDGVCVPLGQAAGSNLCSYSCFQQKVQRIEGSRCDVDEDCSTMNGVCEASKTCRCTAGMVYKSARKECAIDCEDGWNRNIDSCYEFSTEQVTFTQASEYCAGQGAHLVQVDIYAESVFIKIMLTRLKLPGENNGFWTDLYQFGKDGEERWKTTNESLIPLVSNWIENEPNNPDARCTIFDQSKDWFWTDTLCDDPNTLARPLCEKQLQLAPK